MNPEFKKKKIPTGPVYYFVIIGGTVVKGDEGEEEERRVNVCMYIHM